MDTISGDSAFTDALNAWIAANQLRDYSKAEEAGERVLNRAAELLIEEANEKGPPEDLLLSLQAKECEELGDWEGAISVYNAVLTIAEQSEMPCSIWRAHDDLANLYLLVGRKDDAMRHQRLATAAARRDDSIVVLRMALTSEASCMLRCKRASFAKQCIDEGLTLKDDGQITDELGVAWLRILEAQYHADAGQTVDARACLQSVWNYLEQAGTMTIAAGVHAATRAWWTVEASCCQIDDNSAGEVVSLSNALELAKHIDGLSYVTGVYTKSRVCEVLDRLASALWRNGQLIEARSVRTEADDLRASLNLPESQESP